MSHVDVKIQTVLVMVAHLNNLEVVVSKEVDCPGIQVTVEVTVVLAPLVVQLLVGFD